MNKLLEVVSDLRDPINGCPWDLKQTHLSLVPYVLEEAYEVAHAIREDNPDELKEELGDLLLQVILHAQIAKEKNLFDITDILDIITEKLIRRHPHVFQNKAKVSIKEVEDSWETIKNNEKPLNNSKTPISDRLKLKIRPQPSTKAALIISKKASKNGFEWENIDQIWDKLHEELEELKDALKKENTDINIYDTSILSIIDINSKIEILADSISLPEGPLWDEESNSLLFTDCLLYTSPSPRD